jgi:fatty acid amide hydrolase 2
MLRLLAGPDGADNECGLAPASLAAVRTSIDVSAALAGSTSIQRTKVYVLNCDASFRQGFANHLLMSPCDPRSVEAVRRAAESLRSHNVDIIELTLPEFGEAFEMWSTLMGQAQSQPFRGLLRRRGCGAPWELLKHAAAALFSACFGAKYLNCALSASVNTVPALGLSLVERFGEWSSHSHRQRMESLCCNIRDKLNALLGDNSVLLLPPHPVLTPVHNWAWYSLKFFNCAYTAVFNALELPVTSVPLGLTDDADRLPLGVQVVGAYGRDRATLNVARALNDKFGGWQAPR